MTDAAVLGLDFGSNSVRALVVATATGRELGSAVWAYPSGDAGVHGDPHNPHVARQSPADFVAGIAPVVQAALRQAESQAGFKRRQIIGIGVDATGSTPIPVDAQLRPLASRPEFAGNLNALAWMWKDHSAMDETEAITRLAAQHRPQYLAKCGGVYSSEWLWAKAWHCLKVAPAVFQATASWVEFSDYIPAVLAGLNSPDAIRRGVCAAGHKAMYHASWGGFPDAEFLALLDPAMARLHLAQGGAKAYAVGELAGRLCPAWAESLGLPAGLPISVGVLDAHMGALGAGAGGGRLVKIVGTSTCDILTAPGDGVLPDIPGVSGIVPGSVVPGAYGIEAGQSAVGDIFNWYIKHQCLGDDATFSALTREAAALRPGESGLLALDWHNGNRCVLVDARLSGMLLGLTLQSSRAAVFRAWLEATVFGARAILTRLDEYGVAVSEIVACGGIAEKNPFFMQLHADILRRPIKLAASSQTCALGACLAASVVAGTAAGGHASIPEAQAAMVRTQDKVYQPDPARAAVYDQLFALYQHLHDSFGRPNHAAVNYQVMKQLLAIRQAVAGH